MLWLNETREQIKRENPNISVTEIAKKGGEMWRELKDKSIWEEKAAKDKERYQAEMKNYKPPSGGSGGGDDGGSKKRKKEAASPKKATTTMAGAGFKSKEYISEDDSSSGSDSDKKKKKKVRPPFSARFHFRVNLCTKHNQIHCFFIRENRKQSQNPKKRKKRRTKPAAVVAAVIKY